jgi:hypothetical protein
MNIHSSLVKPLYIDRQADMVKVIGALLQILVVNMFKNQALILPSFSYTEHPLLQ